MANIYDDEDQYPSPPAPNAPPASPGEVGPAGPVAGVPPQDTSTPPVATGGGFGGGGGGGPWSLPGLPGLSLPGAPRFNAPVYTAPNAEAVFADPGYQFRVNQGLQAMERSAAAKGMLRGSNTLSGLAEFNQNLASQEYQNATNRYQQEYQNRYRAAYDAFAPEMARYQTLIGGMRDLNRDRYQADLQHALQLGAPGSGGGGEPDLSFLSQLPPPPINTGIPGGGISPGGVPGGGSPYNPQVNVAGDPWTDRFEYF